MTKTQAFFLNPVSSIVGLVVSVILVLFIAFVPSVLLALPVMALWNTPFWLLVPAVYSLGLSYLALRFWRQRMRERHIREAAFPRFLKAKLLKAYPHLTGKDYELVERGMRQYFLACARSKKQFVAMPSKAVDALWHEFILHTKNYQTWCCMALGYFLHHTPAAALGKKAKNNDGLRRAWYWACKDEAIDPKKPSRLPLLFALDMKLAIEGGYTYAPDCKDINRKNADGGGGAGGSDTYCGTDFSSGSYSSDSSSAGDFGGADTSSSDGGSDGGGGDGGGCGGGCGGGGD
jgi:hypothetical protein